MEVLDSTKTSWTTAAEVEVAAAAVAGERADCSSSGSTKKRVLVAAAVAAAADRWTTTKPGERWVEEQGVDGEPPRWQRERRRVERR